MGAGAQIFMACTAVLGGIGQRRGGLRKTYRLMGKVRRAFVQVRRHLDNLSQLSKQPKFPAASQWRREIATVSR